MGWTFDGRSYDEHLVVLNEEGVYRVYDIQGDYTQHSLGAEAQEAGVVDAVVYETGLVALTGQLSLIEIKGWEGSRPMTLASPGTYTCILDHGRDSRLILPPLFIGLSHPPSSWDVLPPDHSISRHVEVLISSEATIISVDNSECIDQVRSPVRSQTCIPFNLLFLSLSFTLRDSGYREVHSPGFLFRLTGRHLHC